MSSIRFENCGQNYPVQSVRYLRRILYINAKEPCARKTQLPAFAPSLPVAGRGNALVTELLPKIALFCLLRSTQSEAYRPLLPNYQSTYSDIVASAFEGNSWFGTYHNHVPRYPRPRSERINTTFRTYRDHVRNVSIPRSERIVTTFRGTQDYVLNVS